MFKIAKILINYLINLTFQILGGIFQEISLKAYPTYTVIGPGPKSPAVLECTISGDFNYSSDVHSSWLLEDSTILAFDDIPVKSNSIIPT